MTFKSSILTLTLAVCTAIVSANNLQAPVNRKLGAHTQVHWTVSPTDPPAWTLFLMNPNYIFGLYAILGENIDNSLGVVNITIPTTLDTKLNYVLKAVNSTDVDMVFNESPIFQVHA